MDTTLGSNLTKNRKGMVKILNLLKDIFQGTTDEESDEEPDKESDKQTIHYRHA